MNDSKYKLFRNYMCNELGVTKGDIERWTKESVAVEVNKLIGQLDFEGMVNSSINKQSQLALTGNYGDTIKLRETVASMLAKKINISIK